MICPLLARDCQEEKCAWWNAEYGKCAICSIDDSLDVIHRHGIGVMDDDECEDCICECDIDEEEH